MASCIMEAYFCPHRAPADEVGRRLMRYAELRYNKVNEKYTSRQRRVSSLEAFMLYITYMTLWLVLCAII